MSAAAAATAATAETSTAAPSEMVARVITTIAKNTDSRIVLLRNPTVVQWLFGDTSFLPPPPEGGKKTKDARMEYYKKLEDEWGRRTTKVRRPDLTLDKQWTNKFGEHICEEVCILLGKTPRKPATKEHHEPDVEVEDSLWEAKAQTFFTSGTAGEKIMGVPMKYRNVRELYGKPLQILCMGYAEKVCKESYGNLEGARCDEKMRELLAFYRDRLGITFVGASDILSVLAAE
jgi:hypothetical protein